MYICEYESIEKESQQADNDMFMNGYSFDQLGNPKDFMNIRKYFNFIQADIDVLGGIPISNDVRNNLKQRFANGIRFWNSDTVQYDFENYENNLT